MWASWGATAFLCFVGIDRLRAARDLFRAPDRTSGGKARVVLTTERPRVGAALEGYLVLTDKSKPGRKILDHIGESIQPPRSI